MALICVRIYLQILMNAEMEHIVANIFATTRSGAFTAAVTLVTHYNSMRIRAKVMTVPSSFYQMLSMANVEPAHQLSKPM